MKSLKNLVAAILLLLAVVLVFQNRETVETKLLFASVAMPRAMLLALTFLMGLGAGWILGLKRSKPKAQD